MPVSEYIGHLFERMPLLQHASGEAMAEDMRPLAVAIDAGGADMAPYNSGKGIRVGKWMIRSTSGQKDLRVSATRTSVLQIVQQALTHFARQGQQTVLAMFQGLEEDPILSPVNIFQAKSSNLTAPYTVGIEQLANRVIASPRIAAAFNAVKDFLRLLIG